MSHDDDDRVLKILLGVGAVGLFLLAAALLWAVAKAAPQLLAWWVVILFQLLLAALSIAVAVGATMWLIKTSTTALVERLATLETRHEELLRAVKRRTPTFLAVALLAGQVVLLVADKSFDGKPVPTVAVSIALLLGFWVANELESADAMAPRLIGWALWLTTLFCLPVTIMVFRRWNVAAFIEYLSQFDMATRVFAGMTLVTLVCAPILVLSGRGDASQGAATDERRREGPCKFETSPRAARG